MIGKWHQFPQRIGQILHRCHPEGPPKPRACEGLSSKSATVSATISASFPSDGLKKCERLPKAILVQKLEQHHKFSAIQVSPSADSGVHEGIVSSESLPLGVAVEASEERGLQDALRQS